MLRIIGNLEKSSLVSKLRKTTGLFTLNEVAKYRGGNTSKPGVISLDKFRSNKLITSESNIWPHNWYNMLYVHTYTQLFGYVPAPNMGDDGTFLPIPITGEYAYATDVNTVMFGGGFPYAHRPSSTVDGITHVFYAQDRYITGGARHYLGMYRLSNITELDLISNTVTETELARIQALQANSIRGTYSKDGKLLITYNTTVNLSGTVTGSSFRLYSRTGETYTLMPLTETNIITNNLQIGSADISYDNKYIALTTAYDRIYLYSIETGIPVLINTNFRAGATNTSVPTSVVFSPNGEYLAVTAALNGGRGLLSIFKFNPLDNSLTTVPYTWPTPQSGEYYGHAAEFSPDSSKIVYSSFSYYNTTVTGGRLVVVGLNNMTTTVLYQTTGDVGSFGTPLFNSSGTTMTVLSLGGYLCEYSINGNTIEPGPYTYVGTPVHPQIPNTVLYARNLFTI
mgnify:CR=1 FL=1